MRKPRIKLQRTTHYRIDNLGQHIKVKVLRRLLVGKAEQWSDKLNRVITRMMTVVLETLTLDGVLSVARKIIKTILPDWLVMRFRLGNLVDLAFGAGLA